MSAFEVAGACFWATHGGAELDLLIMRGGKRYGFECKLSDAPGTTRSMRVSLNDLELAHLWVVYPGDEAYPLDERISVLPVANIPDLARSLGVGKERDTSARPAAVPSSHDPAIADSGKPVPAQPPVHIASAARRIASGGGVARSRGPRRPRQPAPLSLRSAPGPRRQLRR